MTFRDRDFFLYNSVLFHRWRLKVRSPPPPEAFSRVPSNLLGQFGGPRLTSGLTQPPDLSYAMPLICPNPSNSSPQPLSFAATPCSSTPACGQALNENQNFSKRSHDGFTQRCGGRILGSGLSSHTSPSSYF